MKKVCPKGGCIFPFTQNDNFGQLWTTLDKRRLIQGFRPPPQFSKGNRRISIDEQPHSILQKAWAHGPI